MLQGSQSLVLSMCLRKTDTGISISNVRNVIFHQILTLELCRYIKMLAGSCHNIQNHKGLTVLISSMQETLDLLMKLTLTRPRSSRTRIFHSDASSSILSLPTQRAHFHQTKCSHPSSILLLFCYTEIAKCCSLCPNIRAIF